MSVIWRRILAPNAAVGLCSTCTWGTVRKGFGANEVETFCRIVGPNSRVRYAVRECSSYGDRRVTPSETETRRYGFVTELKLAEENQGVRKSRLLRTRRRDFSFKCMDTGLKKSSKKAIDISLFVRL